MAPPRAQHPRPSSASQPLRFTLFVYAPRGPPLACARARSVPAPRARSRALALRRRVAVPACPCSRFLPHARIPCPQSPSSQTLPLASRSPPRLPSPPLSVGPLPPSPHGAASHPPPRRRRRRRCLLLPAQQLPARRHRRSSSRCSLPSPAPAAAALRSTVRRPPCYGVAGTGDGGVEGGRIRQRRPRGRPDPKGAGLGPDGSVHGGYQDPVSGLIRCRKGVIWKTLHQMLPRSRWFWGAQSTHARGFLLLSYSRRWFRLFARVIIFPSCA